jgi:hypothetical protein
MAYTDVPLAAQRISATQDPIRQNFLSLLTLVDPNNKVDYFPVVGASIPTVAAGNVGLYSNTNALTTKNELYFKRDGGAGVVGIPFTAYDQALNNGWTYLPSGILIKFGAWLANAPIITVTFPVAATIPVFSSVFQVLISPFSSTNGAKPSTVIRSIGTTNFTCWCNGATDANSQIRYIVIGI